MNRNIKIKLHFNEINQNSYLTFLVSKCTGSFKFEETSYFKMEEFVE